jgi:phenylpyruvate tautomerase PptA (4-oxalocrotonate tautomerase family)
MPIVTIELMSDEGSAVGAALPSAGTIREITDALGAIFDSRPSGTWVKFREQSREHYAENNAELTADVRPVVVEILKADLPDPASLTTEARAICLLVAKALTRPPENVHVVYQPAARGRIAFGGELVR